MLWRSIRPTIYEHNHCLKPSVHLCVCVTALYCRPHLSGSIIHCNSDLKVHHLPAPKLISLPCDTTEIPPTYTHTAQYLHLSLSHRHGRGQRGGPLIQREKGQPTKGVPHWSSVLFRRSYKEDWMGSRGCIKMGPVLCYLLKLDPWSWPAYTSQSR